ncbi:MAG: tRNA dihydrouridine(20/20a) synthase DusA, partial [Pseudomonadota bacterium]
DSRIHKCVTFVRYVSLRFMENGGDLHHSFNAASIQTYNARKAQSTLYNIAFDNHLFFMSPSSTTAKQIYVAPMMAWTDRHCRYLHRLYAPHVVLFTEMVTTPALLHGEQWHLLEYSPAEQPLILQLGGSEPDELARCASRAQALGFAEINLNVGCPSERVQRGAFGACLMREPELVGRCIAAMQREVDIPCTVKCRLGVDDDDSDTFLWRFVDHVAAHGCGHFYVHARKAILSGLSPAQNRSIPPLQHERVAALKARTPELAITLNGGITDVAGAVEALEWADGVMIGRAAYHNPELLGQLEREVYDAAYTFDVREILHRYQGYIESQMARGVKLHALTRHLLHSLSGRPGARRFRQLLSDQNRLRNNDPVLVTEALAQVFGAAA